MGSYRFMFCIYSSAGLVNSLLTLGLSEKVEVQKKQRSSEEQGMLEMQEENVAQDEEEEEEYVEEEKGKTLNLSSQTKKKVWLLSGLFGVDNLAGGLVPVSVIHWWLGGSQADKSCLQQHHHRLLFHREISHRRRHSWEHLLYHIPGCGFFQHCRRVSCTAYREYQNHGLHSSSFGDLTGAGSSPIQLSTR
jgi:hypothetical protein